MILGLAIGAVVGVLIGFCVGVLGALYLFDKTGG